MSITSVMLRPFRQPARKVQRYAERMAENSTTKASNSREEVYTSLINNTYLADNGAGKLTSKFKNKQSARKQSKIYEQNALPLGMEKIKTVVFEKLASAAKAVRRLGYNLNK